MPAQPGTHINLTYKKNWKKFRKGLLDLLHQTTTMNQAVMTTILKQTKLEPLKERRKQNRLLLFCNGVHHLVDIPTDDLQRPLKTTKNIYSQHYLRLPAKTDILKLNFLLNTVKDWNLLLQDIINKICGA